MTLGKRHSKLHEFSIIDRFFKSKTIKRPDVIRGIGDDGALSTIKPDLILVSTLDTLITGIHFPTTTKPYDIGYKALAVNLSDLAAMGATPTWFLLGLSLPNVNARWLNQFSDGLMKLANQFQMQLIGGDTTSGNLSITICAQGVVPKHSALQRNGAKPGDKIYVSNTLGDAGVGLAASKQQIQLAKPDREFVLSRLNQPTPNILLGKALRHIASSAIDISDGLLQDLGHILKSSGVGAKIDVNQLPLSSALTNLPKKFAQQSALTAGDDYELCFTISPLLENKLMRIRQRLNIKLTCIGTIVTGNSVSINGRFSKKGYNHFA